MCAHVLALLAVCAIAGVAHIAPVVSQSTAEQCSDDDCDTRVLSAISGLQDTVERQHRAYQDSLQQLQHSMEEQEKQLTKLKDLLKRHMVAKDCDDLLRYGHNVSGVYEVYLDKARKFVKVYCDMETDEGGWLVFQRRQDGSVDFYRDWADYKAGFGDVAGEFWLGNDLLNDVTSQRAYILRIDLEDFDNASRFAVYPNFAVSSESDNFRVSFGAYSGTAGDSFSRHVGSAFSTRDRDNDVAAAHCAQMYKGGWWYKDCHDANLNGQYLRDSHTPNAESVVWRHWRGYHPLKKVSMKIRP